MALIFCDGIDSDTLGGPDCPLLSPVGPPADAERKPLPVGTIFQVPGSETMAVVVSATTKAVLNKVMTEEIRADRIGPEIVDASQMRQVEGTFDVEYRSGDIDDIIDDIIAGGKLPPEADVVVSIKTKKPRKRLTKDSPKKAYKVLEVDEHTGGIVFARCNAEARRWGANEYGDGEWDYVECSRAPEYDQYVNGGLNDLVLWNHGWWFECMCGHRLDSDFYNERRYEREDKFKGKRVCEVIAPIRDEPVLWKNQLYCTPWCKLNTAERWGKEKSDKALAVTMAKLTGRFDDCTILEGQVRTDRVNVGTRTFADDWGRERQAPIYQEVRIYSVRFTFPDAKYGGTWHHTTPTKVVISQADAEAWDAFKGKTTDGSLPD